MAESQRPTGRRGNITILLVALMALLAMTALVVDVGFLYAAQTELQVAMDSAALAGVGKLDYTEEGVTDALETAVAYADRHYVFGAQVDLPEDAISTGFLDENGAFVPSGAANEISALYIDHTKVDIPAWFSAVAFGRTMLAANARSLASRSPKRTTRIVGCYLPLAIPDCVLDDPPAFQNMTLQMGSAGNDNVGWADLGGNPTPGSINNALLGICDHGSATVGDPVYLNNGVIASSLQEVASILNGGTSADTLAWDDARWGAIPTQMDHSSVNGPQYGANVLEGPILLFEAPGGSCLSGLQFNQSQPITGFTWAVIYDVSSTGGDKNIRVRLDMVNEYDWGQSGGGGEPTNVLAPSIGVLVQ